MQDGTRKFLKSTFIIPRYWEDEEQTKRVMKTDADGTLWMHTGDEGIMDEEGYLRGTIFAFSKRQDPLTCSVSGWQDQSMSYSSLLNLINFLTAL